MTATLKDVAAAAGVSPSTVSRVMAGNRRISSETHERVRQAMKELNYHPHAIARSLVTKSSRTIGLVTSRSATQTFANPFFPEVIRGISSILEAEGYHLLLSSVQGEAKEKETCLDLLRSRQVDGMIVTSSRLGDKLIEALIREQQDFVLIGRPLDKNGRMSQPEVHWVNNDNVAAASVAVEHLVELGHRRIAFINGPRDWIFCHDRLEGYKTALAEAGIPFDPELVREGNITEQDGHTALDRLLSLPNPPTAIIGVDDLLALGVLEGARRRGVRIPQDLAVMGFNNDPITAWTRPSLSTLQIPVFDLGAMAARMLLGKLNNRPVRPHQVILPSQIVARESTVGL